MWSSGIDGLRRLWCQWTSEEAKETIRKNVFEKKKHDARERWIEKLRSVAEIELLEKGIVEFVRLNPYENPDR